MSIIVEQLEQKLQERKEAWWGWHKKNPQVWNKFEEYTLEAIATGRKHYSHWAIINRIRWNREIETNGGEFKISNDYISFYARLFHARHPDHHDFFRLKQFKEEKLIDNLKSVDAQFDQMQSKLINLNNAVRIVNQNSQLLAAEKNILFTGKR
jgi:HPt (histidine-containing phosphotransfer) domain-containing protein